MTRTLVGIAVLFMSAVVLAPLASAATMHHHPVHHGKYRYYSHPRGTLCKGEFMHMKGGKCMDARDKPANS